MSDAESECPYCASAGECEHVLLLVDTTFRTAEGGALKEAFNLRWARLANADESFNEAAAFNQLLDEVGALADAECTTDFEEAPARSSTLTPFFVGSEAKATAASASFGLAF